MQDILDHIKAEGIHGYAHMTYIFKKGCLWPKGPKKGEQCGLSVVSRDSVRIAFLVAALNDLKILTSDIGKAYLNAHTTEKVYTITGMDFGEETGRIAIIVRALYGLKSIVVLHAGTQWLLSL